MPIKKVLAEFKREVKKVYGEKLKEIILYGSWARGKATPDSDIDLVLVLEGRVIPGKEIDRIIDVIAGINLKYGVLLSVYPISERNFSILNSPLLLNVRREGVPA